MKGAIKKRIDYIDVGCALSFLNSGVGVRTDTYGNIALYFVNALLISGGVLRISRMLEKLKILRYIGRNSFGIMLYQKFPIMFFAKLCPFTKEILSDTTSTMNCIVALLVGVASIIICLVWNEIMKRIFPMALGLYGEKQNEACRDINISK